MKNLDYFISLGRNNNFNLIRFISALAVILSHSYPLSLGKTALEPFEKTIGISLGEIAVHIFFVTSGFLVTGSLIRNRNILDFFLSRILRIFPALIVSAIFVVILCGVTETKLSLTEYFSDSQIYNYFITNSVLIIKSVVYFLPSVFIDNPYPNVVNGSLWSLPWELRMYLILGGSFFIFKKRADFIILGIYSISLIYFFYNEFILDIDILFFYHLFYLSILFFSGSLLYIYGHIIPINFFIFLGILFLLFLLVIFFEPHYFKFFYYVLFPYIVIYIAYVPKGAIRTFNKLGDYSYGLYIYAFPVQQIIVTLFDKITPLELFNYSVPVTLFLSIFSWGLIEKPSLKLKRRK
ncbi:MAG: acyltransferase [Methylococcales bacterium]|nr:acyltransferase [Methylococcales bacterium]